jgi:hypothetical protein
MSQTLTISDRLLARLEAAARQRGLDSVEQLLETWQAGDQDLSRFQALAERWKKETAYCSSVAKSFAPSLPGDYRYGRTCCSTLAWGIATRTR